jgi:hypothetical protein
MKTASESNGKWEQREHTQIATVGANVTSYTDTISPKEPLIVIAWRLSIQLAVRLTP